MATTQSTRLVDIQETQDVEVVDTHGYATIKTLVESGTDYCHHDQTVTCDVDGVHQESEWRQALRALLGLHEDWIARHGEDFGTTLLVDADELCQRNPADIVDDVQRELKRAESVIAETARAYAGEFPGEALDPEWSGTAYTECDFPQGALSSGAYHSAVQLALVARIRDDVRHVFNGAIDEAESRGDRDRVARLEILREYFCNEPFRAKLHYLVFEALGTRS